MDAIITTTRAAGRSLGTQNPLQLDASSGHGEGWQAAGPDDAGRMHVQPENEAVLVAGAKAGDEEAFTALIGQCHTYVYRAALNITGNREDAEDALQEAILKAYTHLGEFRGESRFCTWLVRIAVNEALMKIRKRSSEQLESLDQPIGGCDQNLMPREIQDWAAENPEQHYANAELQSKLAEAIGKLAPQFRAVLLLRYVENFSTQETAAMLGMKAPAVKSRLLRARLKLRELLTRQFKLSLKTDRTNVNPPQASERPASWSFGNEAAKGYAMHELSLPHRLQVREL